MRRTDDGLYCKAQHLRNWLQEALRKNNEMVQNEHIYPAANFLSDLKRMTTQARGLLQESWWHYRSSYPYSDLENVLLTAEEVLDKLHTRADIWHRANKVFDQQRYLLMRLENGGSSGYKRDLIDLTEAITKLKKIGSLLNSDVDKIYMRDAIQNVEKKRDEIENDLVSGIKKEHARLSELMAGKPGIELLEQIKRQELPELTEKYNFIMHHWPPASLPTEWNEINLDKLEEDINAASHQASEDIEENEQAVLAINAQRSDCSQASDTTADDELPKFHKKKIEKLESALARLRSKSKGVDERGNEKEEDRTEERQQIPDGSMDTNDRFRMRITELEQAIGREFMRVEEERRDEEEQNQIRLALLLLACRSEQPLLSRAKRA